MVDQTRWTVCWSVWEFLEVEGLVCLHNGLIGHASLFTSGDTILQVNSDGSRTSRHSAFAVQQPTKPPSFDKGAIGEGEGSLTMQLRVDCLL